MWPYEYLRTWTRTTGPGVSRPMHRCMALYEQYPKKWDITGAQRDVKSKEKDKVLEPSKHELRKLTRNTSLHSESGRPTRLAPLHAKMWSPTVSRCERAAAE